MSAYSDIWNGVEGPEYHVPMMYVSYKTYQLLVKFLRRHSGNSKQRRKAKRASYA